MLKYFFLLLLINTNIFSQENIKVKIKSSFYSATLNTLLKRNVPEICVQDLYQLQDSFIILDTREEKEFNISHIKSAINVGFDQFDTCKIQHIDRNASIVCYCSVGYRSEKITEKLLKMGFTKVYNLYGSLFEWVNCHYPIVDLKGKETDRIHAYSITWGKFINNKQIIKEYN